jgi:hypothetical protein
LLHVQLISEEIDLLMAQELLSTTPNMENVKLDSMRNWYGQQNVLIATNSFVGWDH